MVKPLEIPQLVPARFTSPFADDASDALDLARFKSDADCVPLHLTHYGGNPPEDQTYFEVAGPRVTEVAGAGIQKISAPAGKSVSVQSPWGASSFGWPKGVKPVAFTITVGKDGKTATIDAPGYTEANRADYKAAIDAVVPVAIAKTGDNKAAKEHTRR